MGLGTKRDQWDQKGPKGTNEKILWDQKGPVSFATEQEGHIFLVAKIWRRRSSVTAWRTKHSTAHAQMYVA